MKEEATRITKRMKEVAKKQEPPAALRQQSLGANSDLDIQTTDSPEAFEHGDVHGIWDLRGEKPPPSSIAARKDTMEARQLARVLDEHYSKLNALNVWSEVSCSLSLRGVDSRMLRCPSCAYTDPQHRRSRCPASSSGVRGARRRRGG